MKKISFPLILISLLSTGLLMSPTLHAEPDDSEIEPNTNFEPDTEYVEGAVEEEQYDKTTRWVFSAGSTTRSINAGFQLNGNQARFDWSRFFKKKSGRGNAGLYRGGSNSVFYDNGYVGPHNLNPPSSGSAGGFVNNNSQISSHPNSGLPGGGSLRIISFQSDAYRYGSSSSQNSVSSSDSEQGVGSYMQWGYHLPTIDSVIVNLITGWSYVSTEQSSGEHNVASLSVREQQTKYTYQYDYSFTGSSTPYIPGQISGFNQFIIADAAAFNSAANVSSPRQSSRSTGRLAARFYAVSRADLDVKLNEIPIGLEIGRKVGRSEVFFTCGTTLNVVDYNLTSSLTWYQSGRSGALSKQRWRDSGTPVKIGAYSGLNVKIPISRSGRFYAEIHSSYRWVDSVHASAGAAEVDIDLSSWESGLGIGIIF
ncbi:MAG: hypothetical protein QM496_06450 [Verrucomicrobiota bacterium]